MYAEYEDHKNNKPKNELIEKIKEKKLLLKSFDIKTQLIKDCEQKIEQNNFKINELNERILKYNFNNSEEYKFLKQNINNINFSFIDLIKLHSFKINYVNKNIVLESKEKVKEVIDTLPKLIEFVKLTDFKYYDIKFPFNIDTILFSCDSFKFWEIYSLKNVFVPSFPKDELEKKMEQYKSLSIWDFRNASFEFFSYYSSYIYSYNECLKYIEEFYKQTNTVNNIDINYNNIRIINDYINEAKKLIILYETKAKQLLNNEEIINCINKIKEDDKKNIYNQNYFDSLNQFKLNIEDNLNKIQIEIKKQVNKTTELNMKIEQFICEIYENKFKFINIDNIINKYNIIKSNINETIDYVLMIYEQSIINNKILLLQIENCFELKNKYELNTEHKELKNKMIIIDKEIKDLQDYIEYKRLENIYGTI